MDHRGEVERPTTAVGSTALFMAAAVQGSEANIGGQVELGEAAAGRGEVPVAVWFHHLHHEQGHGGAYADTSEFRRQPGPVRVVLVGLRLRLHVDGVAVVPVHDNYGYYYQLQPRSGAVHGEALVDLLPDGTGHGEVFVGLLPGAFDAAYDNYGGDYPRQPAAGRGEVFIGPLAANGVGAAFDNSANLAQLLGTGRAGEINLGAENGGGSGTLAQHLRRLIPFAGIGAASVAVNGLAAGPASPAAAFHLFVLLLGGLFLVILHVLRV